MELLFLILIKCLPSQLVVSVASHFHEWLNFGTLKPRPKADNVLCLEAFQRQPGEGTISIFGWECPVRTLKTLSLFSCTKNPTSFNKNRVMGPRQNHSFFLHHYCTIFGSIPDQKPVIPIHSSKFKSPFHSSSQEPKKPIRPSLRRNGSKILGEKKKEVRKLSIPHLLPCEQWFIYHPYQEKWIWQDLASSKFFKIFMLEKSSVWNFCALSQTSFGGETSGSVAKSRRFSQTKNFFPASLSLVSQKPGYEVTVGTVYVPIHQARTKTLRRNSAE